MTAPNPLSDAGAAVTHPQPQEPAPGGRLPASAAPVIFGALLSALMTLVVSGITTARNVGLDHFTAGIWARAFLSSWPIAFPTVLVVAPFVRRLVARLVAAPHAR